MQKIPSDIFAAFKQACAQYQTQEILSFKKDNKYISLTYQDLFNYVNTVAANLSAKIKPKIPVALILENSPDWPIAFFALMRLGAINVPLNPQLEKGELKQFILHSEAKFIITSQKLILRLKECLAQPETEIFLMEGLKQNSKTPVSLPAEIETSGNDIAAIIYTSGTTSMPKGVILTHRNFLSNVYALQEVNLLNERDCLISILPFYHSYPFMANLLLPILTGIKVSFPASLDIEDILECIRETKITVLTGVPRLFLLFQEKIGKNIANLSFGKKLILKAFLNISLAARKTFKINLAKLILKGLHKKFGPGLRLMISGGAKLNLAVARDFYKWGFTILEGYGLTETSPVVSFNTLRNTRFGSIGKPLDTTEIKINTPDASGIGEILIKGENVTIGYYKEEKLTLEAIKDGWFYSGDLGYLDRDGFLYISGRKKEMLVLSSGKKIFPEELESYYKKSPYFEELCLFLADDFLTAVIIPCRKKFLADKIIQIKDRIRWEVEKLSKELPSYQRIKKYIITNQPLPKTLLGKIKRFEVEAKYSSTAAQEEKECPLSGEDKILLASPLAEKITQYIQREFKKNARLDDQWELDLGIDSLDQVGLFLEAERIAGVKLQENERFGIFTLRELLCKLENAKENPDSKDIASSWQEVLKSPPEEKLLKNISLQQAPLVKIINTISLKILKFIMRLLFLLEAKGLENLPPKGPFLICPNHASYLDGPILASSLPRNTVLETYFLGYKAYFQFFLIRRLEKSFRLISLDPAENLNSALNLCAYLLSKNKIICLFPEGRRSQDGNMYEFKKGAGVLIKELNIPVVPVYIEGSFAAWPAHKIFPNFSKIKITFLKKMAPEELAKNTSADKDAYQNIVDNLREIIRNYADSLN